MLAGFLNFFHGSFAYCFDRFIFPQASSPFRVVERFAIYQGNETFRFNNTQVGYKSFYAAYANFGICVHNYVILLISSVGLTISTAR